MATNKKKTSSKKNTAKKKNVNKVKVVNEENVAVEEKVHKAGKLIIEGHDKNPFVIFWNWGWGIYYKNPEVWNYLIVGALTTVLCIATKMGLLNTCLDAKNGLQLQIAEVVSWAVAVVFAFVANKFFVFKSKTKSFVSIIKELLSFVGGRVFTQVIQMGIMFIFVTWLELNSNGWVWFFTLICQVMQIVVNYVISKLIVFKKKA